MKVLLISDAWFPQVNGVVRTLSTVKKELEALGHLVLTVTPERFKTIPCPTYPEIRLAWDAGGTIDALIDFIRPNAIHIATEGPLGLWGRHYCRKRGYPFTTSFHTRFPEYIRMRFGVPAGWTYSVLRWFHSAAAGTMAAETILHELEERGFRNLRPWSRGVDTDLFRPRPKEFLPDPRPVFLYVGRVAVEKGVAEFLDLDLPGTKVVVGEGPQLNELRRRYPAVRFVGNKQGEELAQYYAASDAFVFPSRTDTFGLVLLEALASGVPVAAYPVTGPNRVVNGFGVGCLDNDLRKAALQALSIEPERCRRYASQYSWRNCAQQFLSNLRPFRG